MSAAVAKLKSNDEGQLGGALDEIAKGGPAAAAAAPAVAEVLSRGLNQSLSQKAIETLGDLESPEGSAVLAEYTRHRAPPVRRAAVKALTRTKGPSAPAALRAALSDSDPQVRGNAAAGLGATKAKDAVPDLYVALGHKVNEAAVSIGQLCTPDQCEKFTEQLGKLPFDVASGGIEQIVFRPAAEISDDVKIKVLGPVRELGTAEAHKFLKETIQDHLPKEASPRLKQSVEQAVKATAGGLQ